MSQDIVEGYVSVNQSTLKRFDVADLRQLFFELGKFERTVRGNQIPVDDIEAIKLKNRKLQRIAQALMIIRNFAKVRYKAVL